MSDFTMVLDTDLGQVESARVMSVPITGPMPADHLVLIDGIAVLNLDTDNDLHTEDLRRGDVFIRTNFRVRDAETFVDASTWISLASLSMDDSGEGDLFDADDVPILFAVDSASAAPDTNGRIMIHAVVAVAGDIGMNRLSYQVNVLLQAPGGLARILPHLFPVSTVDARPKQRHVARRKAKHRTEHAKK